MDEYAELHETAAFLDGIEGHGYGGMASYEVARKATKQAADAIAALRAENERLVRERDEARIEVADSKLENGYFIGWNSGWDDAFGRMKFPTMLRKMWSGGEVQAWLDERKREQSGPVKGSLSERMFAAEARATDLAAQVERLREALRSVLPHPQMSDQTLLGYGDFAIEKVATADVVRRARAALEGRT
jgi:hypothetical protein